MIRIPLESESVTRITSRIVEWITTPYTIFLVIKDREISRPVKLRAIIGLVLISAYVVSPIDVIPDFIPIAGWLDDLIIVPLGISLVRTMTPGFDVMEKREKAQARVKRIVLWTALSLLVAVLLVLIWLGLVAYLIVKAITG